ncbi:MAG: SusC/RagA family TonB-linked outer membrane protein [Cyclobacteriaceae bacterium]
MRISTHVKCWCLFLLSLTLSIGGYAQDKTVSGTVTDGENNDVLPGVNVLIKGTTQGTVTDMNGEYRLTVPGSDAVIVFTSIGYTAEEVTVGNQSTINLTMLADIQSLSEIVVTGYSTEDRREVTGAVGTVEPEELVAIPSGNVEQQLQGRVGGVTVITNGQPGTSSIVRVRGFGSFGGNQPLFIVDGIPVEDVDFLQPDDIETTTVLKDAPSASIYGARAANGVIVYTTKKGSRGGKMKVSYDGVFGVTVPGTVDNILSPQEEADMTWRAISNTARQLGETPVFDHPQYGSGDTPVLPDYLLVGSNSGVVGSIDLEAERALYNNDPRNGSVYLVIPANKAGTNWYDAITEPAILNRHNLGFSGGTERSRYYVGLGMQNQGGILLHQRFERYSMRINSEHDVFDNFRIGENIQATYISRRGLLGADGGVGVSDDENDFTQAIRMPSIIPVYDAFGGYAGTQARGFNNPRNPVAARDRSQDNNGFGYSLIGNIYAELDLFEGLTLRSSFGGSLGQSYSFFYNRPSYENSENNSTFSYGENAGFGRDWIFTNTATYETSFGPHKINALAGVEALNTGFFRAMGGTGQEPFSRDLNYITLTNTINRNVDSNYSRGVNFFSIFGQVRYNYNDKYMINGVLRRDGSSRFGQNNRYGIFPAASAAWRISEEDFMRGTSWIDDLKIRGGWGQMGNSNNVNPLNQYSLYASNLSQSYYDIGGTNAAPAEGFFRSRIGNPNAQWETAVTSNIGFDGVFFNGNLELVLDVWRKDTDDILYALETPAVIGFVASDPAVNIANMRNQGIDLEVLTRGNITNDVGFEVKLTGSFLSNEIVEIAEEQGVDEFLGPQFRGISQLLNQVGFPISSFYGYEVVGLFQNEAEVANSPDQDGKGVGRFRFADLDGDGVITPDDRTYLGDPVPDFTGGLNIVLDYRNFELTAFAQAVIGADIWNQTRWFTDFYPSFTGAAKGKRVLESFTFENGGNTVPIYENVSNFSTNTQASSYFVESGDYLRLANLQLAYNLPSALLDDWGMSRFRVYLQATNLLTISNYEGLDPGVAGDADTELGIDVGNPPVPRGYNIGVNLTF